jgi:hypothetical protein
MEAAIHYVFQLLIFPWMSGESNLMVPADGEFTRLRYSSRLFKVFGCVVLVFLALAALLALRLHGTGDVKSIFRTFGIISLLIAIPLIFAGYFQVTFNDKVLRLRRLLRPTIVIPMHEIRTVELIDRGYNYKVVTTSGRTYRLSRFIRGVDRLANKMGAGQMSCGNS